MKGVRGAGCITAVLAVALMTGLRPGQAQPSGTTPDTVIDVRVEGNKVMSASAILADVKTRPGQPYNEQVVRDDEQRLLKTRRFDGIRAIKTPTDKGILVTFQVIERPLVSLVQFQGNKTYKSEELSKLLVFGQGDPIDLDTIARGADAIQAKYTSDGYFDAAVSYDQEAIKDKGQVIYRIVEGPMLHVSSIKYKFEDHRSFPDFKLNEAVKSSARWWPFITGQLDAEQVSRDVLDLRNFYRGEGFLDAKVGRELVLSPDKKKVGLIFLIKEGVRYRIRNVVAEGNTVFSTPEIMRQIKLNSGAFFNGLQLKRDLDAVKGMYGEIGYIDSEVNVRTSFTDQPGLVDLVFTIHETKQYHIGKIEIRGNEVTRMNVIRRELTFRPGQLYNTKAIDESKTRLRESGLFEPDKVTINPIGTAADTRDALVEIEEGKTAQFLIGVGVSSNAGLLGSVSYTERNFDAFGWPKSKQDWIDRRAFRGGGQTLRISAEPGTEFSRARIDWREPYLFDQPWSLGSSLFAFTSGRETYNETRFGWMGSLGHKFPNNWYNEVGVRAEGVNISSLDRNAPPDVRAVQGSNLIVGIKDMLVRDTTDSRWLPSAGDRIALSYEQVTGSFNFGRVDADYHIYRTLYVDALDRKHILAGRGAVGSIIGDAPVFERYYGGGLGSMRGFKYRGVSPRQNGEVVGGDSMLFLGGEYTFPLVTNVLRGVVFMDSGTVSDSFSMTPYRVSAGVGLRLHIPFFGPVPMSLDFGFPISKGPDDDTQLISFSFGWVF